MNRILALSIMLTMVAAQCLAADTTWMPDTATIQKLEVAVTKDDGAHGGPFHQHADGIDSYARYYAGTIEGGHHIVRGFLSRSDLGVGKGIHIVSNIGQFPMIADGGCNYADVSYNADSDQLNYIRCHGVG